MEPEDKIEEELEVNSDKPADDDLYAGVQPMNIVY